MKPSAAVAIAKLSKESQKEKIRSAGDGKITAAVAKSDSPNGHPKTRRISELKEFWKPYAEREDQAQTKIHKFAAAHLAYIGGGDPEQYFKTVKELLGDK